MSRKVGAIKLAVGAGALFVGAQAFSLSVEHAVEKIQVNSPYSSQARPQEALLRSIENDVDTIFVAGSAAGAVALVLGAGMTIDACADLLPNRDEANRRSQTL